MRKALEGAPPGATHVLTFRSRDGFSPEPGDILEYGSIPVEVLATYDPYAQPVVDPRTIEDRAARRAREEHDKRLPGRWTKALVRRAEGGEPQPAEPAPGGPRGGTLPARARATLKRQREPA